jgi:hypothetical protein
MASHCAKKLPPFVTKSLMAAMALLTAVPVLLLCGSDAKVKQLVSGFVPADVV